MEHADCMCASFVFVCVCAGMCLFVCVTAVLRECADASGKLTNYLWLTTVYERVREVVHDLSALLLITCSAFDTPLFEIDLDWYHLHILSPLFRDFFTPYFDHGRVLMVAVKLKRWHLWCDHNDLRNTTFCINCSRKLWFVIKGVSAPNY